MIVQYYLGVGTMECCYHPSLKEERVEGVIRTQRERSKQRGSPDRNCDLQTRDAANSR